MSCSTTISSTRSLPVNKSFHTFWVQCVRVCVCMTCSFECVCVCVCVRALELVTGFEQPVNRTGSQGTKKRCRKQAKCTV